MYFVYLFLFAGAVALFVELCYQHKESERRQEYERQQYVLRCAEQRRANMLRIDSIIQLESELNALKYQSDLLNQIYREMGPGNNVKKLSEKEARKLLSLERQILSVDKRIASIQNKIQRL